MFNRIFTLLLLAVIPFFASAQHQQDLTPPGALKTKNATFINITELSFAYGIIHENTDVSVGFQTVNGIKFNQNVSFGLGIGLDKYIIKNFYGERIKSNALMPVFTDLRINIGTGKIQPFFGQAVGYAFCVDQPVDYGYYYEYDDKGGIILSPFFGLKTNRPGKVNLTFSLGYRYQENSMVVTRSYYNPNYSYGPYGEMKRVDHFLTFKTGLTF